MELNTLFKKKIKTSKYVIYGCVYIRMRRQKERIRLAPQVKPGGGSESAVDYGVDFLVKKQKTLQRF